MLVSPLYTKYPYHRAKLQYLGVLLCSLGLVTSGFASAPWQVLVTIGIVYPIGGALYYFPVRPDSDCIELELAAGAPDFEQILVQPL